MTTTIRRVSKSYASPTGPVHALRDIDLVAEPGESVAIIGRNGAGKSTLLQVVAGVLAPTSGAVERPERVASLLELGSGFHPDLSGRENLDIGVALAALSARQVRTRIDQIVEFSGLADALDQPVKHYSDGMKARLACSIAVHAEPDLLVVDEVLAVGDASFQRQVLERIAEMTRRGTTLLLVTHSVDLARTTRRCVWIEDGRVVQDGPAGPIIDEYEVTSSAGRRLHPDPSGSLERAGIEPAWIEPGDGFAMSATLRTTRPSSDLHVRVDLRPVVGDEPWMRSEDELPEHRDVNLVATTAPRPLGRLGTGRFDVEVVVERVPISETNLDATMVVVDAAGRIHDELSCELRIGEVPARPTYLMSVAPVAVAAH